MESLIWFQSKFMLSILSLPFSIHFKSDIGSLYAAPRLHELQLITICLTLPPSFFLPLSFPSIQVLYLTSTELLLRLQQQYNCSLFALINTIPDKSLSAALKCCRSSWEQVRFFFNFATRVLLSSVFMHSSKIEQLLELQFDLTADSSADQTAWKVVLLRL